MKPSHILPFVKKFRIAYFDVCAFAFLFLLAACNKEDFQPDMSASPGWHPDVAFPLAYSEIGIQDLAHVNDSSTNLVVNGDQLCTIIYQGNIFDITASQILQLSDQSRQTQFSLNNSEILTLSNMGQVQLTFTEEIQFAMSQGASLDSLVFKNGDLQFGFDSDFPADVEIQMIIPSMKKNGVVFNKTLTMLYQGSTPVNGSGNYSLQGYHADLSKNGTTSNTLPVTYSITIKNVSGAVSGNNTIQCNSGIQSMQYQSVYGYMGQLTVGNLQDSIELSI